MAVIVGTTFHFELTGASDDDLGRMGGGRGAFHVALRGGRPSDKARQGALRATSTVPLSPDGIVLGRERGASHDAAGGGETQVQGERRRTHEAGQAGGCIAVGPSSELAKRRAAWRRAPSLS